MLDRLGTGLKDAFKKLAGKSVIDRAAVDELVKDLQRALLQSDVNVRLVMSLSQSIKKRSLEEEPPKGMSVREHVLRIVYEELVTLMGKEQEVLLGPQTILMAGLQGSGKGVICADVFRPGAYEQLNTLCQKINVPCYGEPGETDATQIVKNGLLNLKNAEVIIVDTQGRHGLEDDLIDEIIALNEITQATHRWLVIDAALGQQAREQYKDGRYRKGWRCTFCCC